MMGKTPSETVETVGAIKVVLVQNLQKVMGDRLDAEDLGEIEVLMIYKGEGQFRLQIHTTDGAALSLPEGSKMKLLEGLTDEDVKILFESGIAGTLQKLNESSGADSARGLDAHEAREERAYVGEQVDRYTRYQGISGTFPADQVRQMIIT
jgi:hypothetical protein